LQQVHLFLLLFWWTDLPARRKPRFFSRQGVSVARWEHYAHEADVGIRGIGASKAEAFEQAALAMTAAITELDAVRPLECVHLRCKAPDDELLFADFLNALVYEIATRRMLFCRFAVRVEGDALVAEAWGEPVDVARHHPAVEVKGATYTTLQVVREDEGWRAQTVIDV
jgi:SHS2 domain-containing protein